jgi:anaphase-promoting complex subunit 1
MADLFSLGIHRPSALPYLISESILPENPTPSDYVWKVYPGPSDDSEHEVLYTSNCVVWSQDGHVRKVFNFDSVKQPVSHALITRFRNDPLPKASASHAASNHIISYATTAYASRWGTKPQRDPRNLLSLSTSDPLGFNRALVIILKSEMHIHYLSGPNHVLNVPFDVEKAFPAIDGLVVQRRAAMATKEPPTPTMPAPPPNSFNSPQPYLFSQPKSPELRANRYRPSVLPPSPSTNFNLDALFQDLNKGPGSQMIDELPRFYSLENPLSDLAPVSHASVCRQPRFPRPGAPSGPIVEYDMLDPAEELVYVSSQDELAETADSEDAPLFLMVTVNRELGQITVWQAWYLESPKLSDLLSQRAAHQAAKAKRPSSVMTGRTAGAATPALKHRDHRDRVRESFAASMRLSVASTTRPSQDDEEVMASQMDPEYLLKKPSRGLRRVSSILSRGDVGNSDPSIKQTALGASFSGAGRRYPSMGSFTDRDLQSFGGNQVLRKSRASTPGSLFSKSIGPDDATEIENSRMQDYTDEYESAERLIGATHKSAGTESVLGSSPDGLRKELVIRKLDVFMADVSNFGSAAIEDLVRVFPLAHPSQSDQSSSLISLYILDVSSKSMTTVKLRVQKKNASNPQSGKDASTRYMPIPFLCDRNITHNIADITKLQDGRVTAIAYLSVNSQELGIVPARGVTWSLPISRHVRVSHPSNVASILHSRETAQSSTPLQWPCKLQHSGTHGKITLATPDGLQNRFHIRLSPRSTSVRQILELCQTVLPAKEGGSIAAIWCNIHHRFAADETQVTSGLDVEWETMIVTLFAFAVGSIGRTLRGNHRSKSSTADGTRLGIYGSQLRARNLKSDLDKITSPAWSWLEKPTTNSKLSAITPRSRLRTPRSTHKAKSHSLSLIEYEMMASHLLHDIAVDELDWLVSSESANSRYLCCTKIMLVLSLFREEQKLSLLTDDAEGKVAGSISAIIAQFGQWLSLDSWSYKAGSHHEPDSEISDWELSSSTMNTPVKALQSTCPLPQSIFAWVERNFVQGVSEAFLDVETIACLWTDTPPTTPSKLAEEILPRLKSLRSLASRFSAIKASPSALVETMKDAKFGSGAFETLPEGVLAPLREAISRCQTAPPTTWSSDLLEFVAREDLIGLSQLNKDANRPSSRGAPSNVLVPHDVQTIYSSADRAPLAAKTHEAERHAVISLIFSEDRRFVDAAQLMNPTAVQVAECPPQPEWSEVEHLEQQKRVMQWVMIRTLALSPGDGMIHFESQRPLLSEKFHIKGFSTSCQMKPMDNTISADRSGFTEEKFAWTFFHAGVSAGLSISRNATGIDTSWIVFNKPSELNNRHAGFLLALGINGHLRSLAKWLAFKYLTPKHNMTSIGLLLGLSASYLGTMDTLLTRMLSVHITRMLPHGAAELNVSPSTQTAGLMGIGLVYYDTQHRRMSEIMLSEVEHREIEDPGSTMDQLRDESYRLAAGFALGYINIGKGRDLRGLHGMNLLERLLTVAIGPRPVELVHVVDKATAGAVVAITLIYMKTGDQSVARKINIPDTITQLEHCRPDMLLLRTVASHLIMWDETTDEPGWIQKNLPSEYAHRYYGNSSTDSMEMTTLPQLRSKDVPVFNILTGLAWSLALRFAGSGNERARDQVIAVLKSFIAVSKQDAFFYDAKLARATVKRCIDVLALAMATIMAGTGDLQSFRYLRSLHGRVDAETTYGSHLAAHLAIGTLFLGGGTYTFGTSDFAIASLMCGFYPLFPSDVLDNRVHLQALRHFWVFAAEPRCIVVQDVDTKRPIHVKLRVVTRDGRQKQMTSPCLLPELGTISRISTDDPTYWQVTLDFAANPKHLATFRRSQTVYVRRCPPGEASNSVFSTTLSALVDAQSSLGGRQMWEWVLNLPAFQDFDQADFGLLLPSDPRSATHLDEKLTSVDSRLVLSRSVDSSKANALWSLRLLFAWAQDAVNNGDGRLRWIGKHVVDMLRARVAEKTETT